MKFERLLNLIEDTADASPTCVARKFLRFPVAQEKNVQFGTKLLQSLRKRQSILTCVLIDVAGAKMCGQKFTQDWTVMR